MKKIIILILSLILLTACSNNKKENEIYTENLFINGNAEEVYVLRNTEKYNVEYKERLYVLDENQYNQLKEEDNKILLTNDNKIIENFDESEIEKYMKFSSFYQVLLKNGETIQMFDKPNVDFEPEVSADSENIEGVYKHGDHYHVKLKDGTEYISHEDPTALGVDIEVEEYEGEHGNHEVHSDENHEESENSDKESKHSDEGLSFIPVMTIENLKDKDIVSIKLHDDHWHLEDSEGNEYLTYDDPRETFPEIEANEY